MDNHNENKDYIAEGERFDPENPEFDFPGVTIERDIVFGEADGVKLPFDMIYNTKRTAAKRPAFVFLHGGGFKIGESGQFHRMAAFFAKRYDIFSVSVTYRLYPSVVYPAPLLDALQAIGWLRENAAEYGLDTDKIITCGGSAGGYLAMMAALQVPSVSDSEIFQKAGRVNAVIMLNGLVDLEATCHAEARAKETVELFLGSAVGQPPAKYDKVSPVCLFDKNTPPVLFLQGNQDVAVPYKNTIAAYEKLVGLDIAAEICIFPRKAHGWFNQIKEQPPVFEKAESFLKRIGFIPM